MKFVSLRLSSTVMKSIILWYFVIRTLKAATNWQLHRLSGAPGGITRLKGLCCSAFNASRIRRFYRVFRLV